MLLEGALMNKLTLYLFLLLFVYASASEPTWETLKFPSDPTPQSIGVYLRDVRLLTNPVLDHHTDYPRNWRPPTVGVEILRRAKLALDIVPIERLELLLKECKVAENVWSKSRIEVWTESSAASAELIGFDSVSRKFRTPFTQLAINHVIHLPDVPGAQRRTIFEHLRMFPELVAAVSQRPWLPEMDPYVTTALMKEIDQSGWRNTAPYWIDCLLRMNSPQTWKAVEYLMVNCEVAVQVAAYRAVKEAPAPKLDLSATVAKAWRIYKLDAGKGHPVIYAPIAAEHGISEALAALANCIRDKQVPQASER